MRRCCRRAVPNFGRRFPTCPSSRCSSFTKHREQQRVCRQMLGIRKYWISWANALRRPSVADQIGGSQSIKCSFNPGDVEASLYLKEGEVALLATSLYSLLTLW